MRIAPSTPNPGSSLVSSRIGAGELVAEGEVVAVGVPLEEDERGYVLVTGNTVEIWRVRVPETTLDTEVTVLTERETEVGEEAGNDEFDAD